MAEPFYHRTRSLWVVGMTLLATCGSSLAEDEPAAKKEPPKVAMCAPLGVAPGETTKIVVRGWNLEGVSEVRSSSDKLTCKFQKQGGAPVPNQQKPEKIGDQQVEVEVTAAADAPGEVMLTLVSPAGESQPHGLLIAPATVEQESNNGFDSAQSVPSPGTVAGEIRDGSNVDVYAFDVPQAGTIVLDLIAARRGSGLDGMLTLFNQRGDVIAFDDDSADLTDARLEATLPAGRYLVCVQDAHDRGGPAHPYRLELSTKP